MSDDELEAAHAAGLLDHLPRRLPTCRDCGETFEDPFAYALHRRSAHRPEAARGVVGTEAEVDAWIQSHLGTQTIVKPAGTPARSREHRPRTTRARRSASSGDRPRSSDDDPPGLVERKCARCPRTFTPKRRKSVYCPECRDAAKQAKYRKRNRPADSLRARPARPNAPPARLPDPYRRRFELHPALGVSRYLNGSGPKWSGSTIYREIDVSELTA